MEIISQNNLLKMCGAILSIYIVNIFCAKVIVVVLFQNELFNFILTDNLKLYISLRKLNLNMSL